MKSMWRGGTKAATAGMAGLLAARAKGRLKPGELNKTEAKFELHLRAQLQAGEILWYGIQNITLKLAPSTHLRIDFFTLDKIGELHAIDVKGGYMQDDSLAKIKIAAAMFPFRFFLARQCLVKDGGGFSLEEIG
jgi:hypothetical protein